MRRASYFLAVVVMVFVVGCGDDPVDPAAGGETPAPDQNPDPVPAATPDPTPDQTADPTTDPTPTPDPAPSPDPAPDPAPDSPVESCEEAGATECFSNFDCPDQADRCQNLGAAQADEVPCCVPGQRGSSAGGQACAEAADCLSGVCIEGEDLQACSQECTLPSDCPEGMKRCIEISGVGSWCFPGEPPALCEEVNLEGCFSNFDCPDQQRCQDVVDDARFPLACCTDGARGSRDAGEACTLAEDCLSGVCIEGDNFQGCSQQCDEQAPEQCPEGMQRCINIAGFGGWCFPE